MMRVDQAAYEHNGEPVTAERFYAIACDPRRSVAVEACAGAGKTWMLVSRIVRALLEPGSNAEPVQPHEILAITFTKKAAGEMRERLDEWLTTFARADDAALRHELEIRGAVSSADARRRLAGLYRSLLDGGRAVQIRTFHSWFAALVRGAPVAVLQQLGLPVHYELLEDDAPARALVWRRFYACVAGDAALQADFEALVRAHGRFQTDKALQAALDKRTEFTLADEQGVVDASVQTFGRQFPEFSGLTAPEDYLTGVVANRDVLQAAASALGRASAATFSAKGAELEQALSTGDVQAITGALFTGTGTARKFGEKIIGIGAVRQAQDLVLRTMAACQQRDAWDYQQRLARLSRVLIAEFTALKREHGWVDMNDVERAALVMLGEPVLSGWVQERLDARIRHLMIDEFQDTNPLQWQALFSWLSSYAGAGRAPSVFLVGDPKQSIYRFRRAEPQVFVAAQQFVRTGLDGDLLSCDHTRRNAVAVIQTVNAVMADAQQRDGYAGFRTHSTSSEHCGATGRLPPIPRAPAGDPLPAPSDAGTMWRDSLTTPRELPEETLRTREAQQAAAWIQDCVAGGLAPQDIMVLSRKRAGLLPVLDALRAAQIPAQIGEKTALIDCCEVQDVVALLDVLVSPLHDLSLARALRSPLFGVSDAGLAHIAGVRRTTRLAWYDILRQSELLTPELQAAGPVLARWKDWLDRLPPHDALQAIYDDGDVLARFAAAAPAVQRQAVLANLRALPGAALALGGGRYATPYSFVRALKAGGTLAPAARHPDAVRLLTIHGAKGLEAEAVLLLDTDTAERRADSMGVLIDWPGQARAPERFVFLASETRPPACAGDVLAREQAARQREELNALYVAMTRARQTLVISSITPYLPTTDSWWQRLQAVPDLAPPAARACRPAPDPTVPAVFHLPCLPAFAVALPVAETRAAADDSDAARVGRAMHRLLEWGGACSFAQRAAAAREFFLSPAQAAQAVQLAQRILGGQGAWAWRAEALAWQGNEVELIWQGQTLRLDRLVQRRDAGHAGQWWVLDYKSTAQPQRQPALLAQLQTYRAAVQHLYAGATVVAAFLTGDGAQIVLA